LPGETTESGKFFAWQLVQPFSTQVERVRPSNRPYSNKYQIAISQTKTTGEKALFHPLLQGAHTPSVAMQTHKCNKELANIQAFQYFLS